MKFSAFAFIAATILLAGSVQAQTAPVGPGCKIAWDYSTADQAKINGFQIEVNGRVIKVIIASARQTLCSEYALIEGTNTIRLRARSLDGTRFSDWARLTFVYETPIATPTNLRVVQ
jgi:hypothetical protein